MEGERALTVWNKKSPPVMEGFARNIEERVFRSLPLAFLWAGIEPPRHFVPAGSLKPADPVGVERTLLQTLRQLI
ncbi:hypothetical protein BBI15_12670 [Planococcus plakortidis]|uniref:Uncharacterized protein n=1 Tax=Planococcus plakortidis TaxID=1038856 RepID=A0A1C7EAD7_9BACL|nr:hypothetical protein BBI15_12670 [Planococcus plakortidis]